MKDKHTIVFLGKLPPPYIGPTVATRILLNSPLREKYRLLHLDTSDHRDINTLGAFDIKNLLLPFWHYIKLIILIVRQRPDAIYIPSAQTTVAFLRDTPFVLLAKAFRLKVICHLRGGNFLNWFNDTGALMQWLVKRVQRMVDCQIVLGHALIGMFVPFMPTNRIHVVPNGGDFPVPRFQGPAYPKHRILFLANFIRSKGVLEVLRAAPIVIKRYPQVEFIFAGSWRDKATQLEFIQFMKDHPEIPAIVMPPIKDDAKFALLSSADVFVFPTYYPNEGHPWCILEAMASGLPIISTDHGAISETVHDRINGFLVEKGSPAAVAEKLLALIDDQKLRLAMSRESRRLYESNFTEKTMVEKMSNAFDTVLA